MDSTGRAHRKRTNDVFRKSSSVLSFTSIILIVALFLRMEMTNKRTQLNELRILPLKVAWRRQMKLTKTSRTSWKRLQVHANTKLFTLIQTTLIWSMIWINLASTIRFPARKNRKWRKWQNRLNWPGVYLWAPNVWWELTMNFSIWWRSWWPVVMPKTHIILARWLGLYLLYNGFIISTHIP